ncbi:MAG: hypothetical protein CL470_07980 [Acidimicrobiaceae bacterium]|nr:hypothetical protein [Acidimicrobiaceae bacterium]|tara:strand:- start:193 stop:444 length:252 start_codon:yes stop_codon:yes gene_type:complete
MSVNFQHLAPIIAACVTTGGIVFQIGKQSERLETLGFKVQAQEKTHRTNSDAMNDMNQKLTILTNDMSHIKRDIHDIKVNMKI